MKKVVLWLNELGLFVTGGTLSGVVNSFTMIKPVKSSARSGLTPYCWGYKGLYRKPCLTILIAVRYVMSIKGIK